MFSNSMRISVPVNSHCRLFYAARDTRLIRIGRMM